MNYWPAYMSNLAETAKPMINYIDDMRYYGRIAAKEYAGIESKEGQENGWLVHTQATPFGWTTPGWNYYWGWSPAANAWMMQNVYDYYKFTKMKLISKKRFIQCSRKQPSSGIPSCIMTKQVTVGYLLHPTHQSMEPSRLGIPLTNL